MARTSSSRRRRRRESDPMDSLKPLVVLGLLGTILYGAWSVVQKGPGSAPAGVTFGDAAAPTPPQVTFGDAPSDVPAPLSDAAAPPPAHPLAGAEALHAAASSVPPAQSLAAVPPAPFPAGPQAPLADPVAPPPTLAPVAPPLGAPEFAAAPLADPAAAARQPVPSAAFATAWSDAHDKLRGGRYAEALAVLSVWHDDPALSLEESQRLEDLLGQLAGTVIYSQKDLLFPPYVVAPGDTLQSIAAPLQVPWQLLGKINGVPDPAQLVPGEHLKVVRGPFDAVISVSRRRMSLQVGGNYAGSFPVVIGRALDQRVGQSVPVVEIRRPGATPDAPGFAAQVSFSAAAGKSVLLGDGLLIEGVEDPSLVTETASPSSIVVSLRDLDDIADILGAGSQVLVRR